MRVLGLLGAQRLLEERQQHRDNDTRLKAFSEANEEDCRQSKL